MKEETETVDSIQLPPFFYEIFDESLPRHGPGDSASTRRALKMLSALDPSIATSAELRILDVGCGTGAQTLEVARNTKGTITALDNHEAFLKELQRRAATAGLGDRIRTCLRDMHTLGPDTGTFDLVWAESSLFVMGFKEGTIACYERLVRGGFFGASEMCWLRNDAPQECRGYFAEQYPAMTDNEGNLAMMRDAGFEIVGHFTLPESAWLVDYYTPLEARVAVLREEYPGDAEKTGLLDAIQEEIEMYRKNSRYYGYAFYLGRRP